MCRTIYDGLILPSYLWLVLDVFLFSVLESFLVELVFHRLRRCFIGQPAGEQDIETAADSKPPPSKYDRLHAYKMSLLQNTHEKELFLLFQVLVAFLSFFIILVSNAYDRDDWTNYQNVYGLIVNSAPTNALISVCLLYIEDDYLLGTSELMDPLLKTSDPPVSKYVAPASIIMLVTFMPALLTNILPGLLVYFPMVAFFAAAVFGLTCFTYYLLAYVMPCIVSGDAAMTTECCQLLRILLTRGAARLFLLLTLSTCYNYSYLLYNYNDKSVSAWQYGDVINDEAALRSQSMCLIENAASNWKNAMAFFSFV